MTKLAIETPEQRHSRRSGVFIVNFEHISNLLSSASIVDFEQVNLSWVLLCLMNQKQHFI